MLRRGFTRETEIRRDAAGRWFLGGEPITHPRLVRSFEGWIDRAEDGRYCLSNEINWAYVELTGPPYFVKSVHFVEQTCLLRLSGDREEPLNPQTLRMSDEGHLWCDVRQGRVPARFDSHAATQLAAHLEEKDERLFFQGREVPVVANPITATSGQTS